MKIKDIEKNLKKESESIKVPDVYARAKRAPINRLLSDPVHAFQRKMVMRMLFIAFVIVIVAVVAMTAIWLTPKSSSVEEYGYIRITINDDSIVGFVVNKAGTVSASITEKSAGADVLVRNSEVIGKTLSEAINALYHVNPSDEVVVSAHFDNYNTANMIAMKAVGAIETQGETVSVATLICDLDTREKLVEYLNAHGRAASVNYETIDLARRYASLASASL